MRSFSGSAVFSLGFLEDAKTLRSLGNPRRRKPKSSLIGGEEANKVFQINIFELISEHFRG